MILVTRLDGTELALNSDLIVEVEACPDTTVRLLGGESLIVRESVDEVVRSVLDFRSEILRRARGERRSDAAQAITGPVPGRAVQLRFLRGFEEPKGSPARGGTP